MRTITARERENRRAAQKVTRPVAVVEPGGQVTIYPSTRAASVATGVPNSNVVQNCQRYEYRRGDLQIRKTGWARGRFFMYAEDYEPGFVPPKALRRGPREVVVDFGDVVRRFASAKAVARHLDVDLSSVYLAIKGKIKTLRGCAVRFA